MKLRGLVFLLLAVGCRPHGGDGRSPALALPASVERAALATNGLRGLSDLAAADGEYLAVPERQRFLVSLQLDQGAPRMGLPAIALAGVPDGLDTESIAWLGGGRFAIGTESMAGDRPSDEILLVEIDRSRHAAVTSRLAFDYTAWGPLRADRNHGIEGLCAILPRGPDARVEEVRIHAVSEMVIEQGEARFAPLALLEGGRTLPLRLRLSSATGRISALACRPTSDGATELVAVERHYGVARLLRFTLPPPPASAPQVIEPEVTDLAAAIQPLPNIEGVTFSPAGDLLLLTDNDHGGITGPTEVIRVRLRPTDRPAPPSASR